MIYSANLLAILIPIILLQYGASLFCLVKLVFLDLPKKKFVLWNFFILIIVGVGVVTFLVCYFKFRDKVFPKKETPAPSGDTLNGDPTENAEIAENSVSQTPEDGENAAFDVSDAQDDSAFGEQ